MGLLGNLSEIISGQRYHKNTTNNAAVKILWQATEGLSPRVRERFRDFIGSAGAVAEAMFWSEEKPSDIDPKNYDVNQFRMFYEAIVASYAHMYARAKPDLAPDIAAAIQHLVLNRESINRLLSKLNKRNSFDRDTASDVWTHIIDEARIGKVSLPQFTVFTTACAYGYRAAIERPSK